MNLPWEGSWPGSKCIQDRQSQPNCRSWVIESAHLEKQSLHGESLSSFLTETRQGALQQFLPITA
jgi:hypothetical protein